MGRSYEIMAVGKSATNDAEIAALWNEKLGDVMSDMSEEVTVSFVSACNTVHKRVLNDEQARKTLLSTDDKLSKKKTTHGVRFTLSSSSQLK